MPTPVFDINQATPAQREAAEEVQRDRNMLGQPLSPMWASIIASPGALRRIAKLGAHCRFDSALTPLQREVAILGAVHVLRFEAEITVHEQLGAKLGLSAEVLKAIGQAHFDQVPQELRCIAQLTHAIATGTAPTAAPLAAARAQFGEQTAVDIVTIAGYYVMLYRVSHTLMA